MIICVFENSPSIPSFLVTKTGELYARYYNKTGYSLGGRTLVLRGYRNGDKYLYFLYVAKNLIKNKVWYDFSADENTCETQQRYYYYFFLSRGQILGHRYSNNAHFALYRYPSKVCPVSVNVTKINVLSNLRTKITNKKSVIVQI
jgi:hypothetical protein